MPIEFLLFAATLLGVAVFHRAALWVAGTGLAATLAWRLAAAHQAGVPGWPELLAHFGHEWVTLANLMLLLTGFALLANHFERSNLPHAIPRYLPAGWLGAFCLLGVVFVLSAVLDNIAAAVIGGVIARHVFAGRVCVGYVAAIVAAANAGGAGSVVGDTTTTMMWLAGISPLALTKAWVGSICALAVFGSIAAWQQHRHAPAERHDGPALDLDAARLGVVALILTVIIAANVAANALAPGLAKAAPLLGLAIWIALVLSLFARRPDFRVLPDAAKGALFLVCLVALAGLMPVEALPPASTKVAFGLGLLSGVFDNIPLTALALKQGGYDWPLLAFAVGFGGSMVWFGSSAGVAISGQFPEARSVFQWLRQGWHIPLAYLVGFAALAAVS